ncbi:MAG: glutamyl-tRNA reductase [Desulfobacteraceae bacterium]|nr:glutamyl-tRNA reductase [Desulfobacteraceae bacterium]MCF8094019.1 glutamyl-tRNA reductase [Desulfobacteraceae bacterium]
MHLPDGSPQPEKPSTESTPELPELGILGINHISAPVELRECLAFSDQECRTAVQELKKRPEISEILIISTCNRVEMLFTAQDTNEAIKNLKAYITETKSVEESRFESSLYTYCGSMAVKHLFRVASSLDSMVLGEPQILGQVKAAYRNAVNNRGTGVILNRLLHKAFSVAKRIRSETGIGDRAVSISYAAVELARKIFGRLEDKAILLVGAGEMAELAVEHLNRIRSTGALYVANRTFEVGVDLARRFSGTAISFGEIGNTFKSADIIISSTGAPEYVITRDQVRPVMRQRKHRPLFFIDIAVPRDIDPAVNRIDNAYVYDIDDLQDVIEENAESRRSESEKAERIIEEAVLRFDQWYESLDAVPTIKQLRGKLDAILDSELKKTLQSMDRLSSRDIQALERMNEAVVKKILHDPARFLKNPGSHRDKSLYIDLTRKIFNLEDE